MTTVPYLDCFWVIQDRFLAGAYPGAPDEETARRKVRSLIQTGIDYVIDLTQPGDTFCPYESLLQEEAGDFDFKIQRLNFPIPDWGVPSEAQMNEIIAKLDQLIDSGKRVYVHCVGGIGRTGTVVACYLAQHGLTGSEALAQLEFLRRDAASWYHRAPESEEQVEFVLNWQKKEK